MIITRDALLLNFMISSLRIGEYTKGEPQADYYSIDEIKKEYTTNEIHLSIKIDEINGVLNLYPHQNDIPYWYYNIKYPMKYTTFCYNLVRGGIVDGDYQLMPYIFKEGKWVKIEREQLAKLFLKEIIGGIKKMGKSFTKSPYKRFKITINRPIWRQFRACRILGHIPKYHCGTCRLRTHDQHCDHNRGVIAGIWDDLPFPTRIKPLDWRELK